MRTERINARIPYIFGICRTYLPYSFKQTQVPAGRAVQAIALPVPLSVLLPYSVADFPFFTDIPVFAVLLHKFPVFLLSIQLA